MNNKRHILFEEWMTPRDFLVRRSFYEGTANGGPNSSRASNPDPDFENYDRIDVNSQVIWETFKKWDSYTTCSKELFEYSLRGIASIYV